MTVATITLESSNGDSVVVSAPDREFLVDDIVLDTDPKGMYDTGFTVRTMSGAFETGGRVVGETVPIRELVLPFWLTPQSRPRFQRLWGTPGNFQKVRYIYDGPSGRRFLILRLAKEIVYTTEDGFDAAVDGVYHAVVSAIAVNPMYEGEEDRAEWVNPGLRFTVTYAGGLFGLLTGDFTLTFGGHTTAAIAHDASAATVQSALEGLPSVGAGNVAVTGTPGDYAVDFSVPGELTGDGSNLLGDDLFGKPFKVGYGPNTGWFEVWNPTDQPLWLEWTFDPAQEWQFPDFAFGQERKWGRKVGEDAERMIVTPELTQMLSVMSDPFMDTYVSADLSNAAGLFNGVEPLYPVPPYTASEADPVLMPVICRGPAGAKVTLRQRRFWSAESGLEA